MHQRLASCTCPERRPTPKPWQIQRSSLQLNHLAGPAASYCLTKGTFKARTPALTPSQASGPALRQPPNGGGTCLSPLAKGWGKPSVPGRPRPQTRRGGLFLLLSTLEVLRHGQFQGCRCRPFLPQENQTPAGGAARPGRPGRFRLCSSCEGPAGPLLAHCVHRRCSPQS